MKTTELISSVKAGALDSRLAQIYGKENTEAQRERYLGALDDFYSMYGEREVPTML